MKSRAICTEEFIQDSLRNSRGNARSTLIRLHAAGLHHFSPARQFVLDHGSELFGRTGNHFAAVGGEPFDQPAALSALLDAIHFWRQESGLELDILCYSGYPLASLQKKHSKILTKIDALIPEPYIDAQPPELAWRGSANQPLVLQTALAQKKYANWQNLPLTQQEKRIQTMTDGKHIWYIGIPARGDMQALESLAESRGVRFEQVSWR